MKIAFLISNLSSNTIFRNYPFAEMLSKKHKIMIVGSKNGPVLVKPTKKISVTSFKRSNFFKNVLNLFNASKKAEIICIANPVADNSLAGLLLKLTGKKMVLDLAEDNSINLGTKKLGERWIVLKQKIVNKITFFADSIIVGTNYLKKKFGGTLIRNPVNFKNFEKAGFKTVRKQFNKKFLVVYGGALKRLKGAEDLIEAFSIVEKEIPQSALIMAGAILSKKYEVEIKKKANLISNNIHFTGYVPLEKLPNYILAGDCLVSPYPNNPLRASQIPTRLFNYMAAERPIVATDVGECRQILQNGNCAIMAKPGESTSIAKGIIAALTNKKLAKRISKLAGQESKKYSFESMQKQVEKSFLVD